MTDPFDVTDATWPPAAFHCSGAFTVREGHGGGQRVSSATAAGEWAMSDIEAAEALHRSLGQSPLFMIRPGENALDAALDARGYRIKDPVNIYEAPVENLLRQGASPMSAFAIWPPLAIMRDLWVEGGIGPDRVAIMDRVAGLKTAILGRVNDRVSGVAFVAIHGLAGPIAHPLPGAGEAVEQGGLAAVGGAGDGYYRGHSVSSTSIAEAARLPITRRAPPSRTMAGARLR